MKQHSTSQHQTPAAASRPAATSVTGQSKPAIVPAPDDIATRAYYTYLSGGSLPGHEEQHWLEAEARLHAEIANGSRHHHSS